MKLQRPLKLGGLCFLHRSGNVLQRATTPPRLITLILLSGFSPLTLNLITPSLTNIAEEFSTDFSIISIAIAGYLAITAVLQLIIGPLSDRIGRRPVLLFSMALFAMASICCAFATDVWTFLVFRMLQSGVAAGYSISLAIVRDTRSEQDTASIVGYISASMGIGPLLGPILGGILDTAFGWRSSFYFYAISGIGLFALCWYDLGETNSSRSSNTLSPLANAGTLARNPLFWAYALCSAFSVGGFFVFITGAPYVAVSDFNITTAEIGIYIGSITAGFMVGSLASGRYASKQNLTSFMMAGRLLALAGPALGFLITASGSNLPLVFFGATLFIGLGNGLTMPSVHAGIMSINPKLAGSAAGLNASLAVAVGSVLTFITGRVLPENHAAMTLLLLIFTTSAVAIMALLWAIYLGRRSPKY